VTAFHAGESFNVIPPYAVLQGTIRTFEPEVRRVILERFHQVVNGVGQAMGCQTEIDLRPLTSAVTNDPETAARVRSVAARVLPASRIDPHFQTMGSEDFSSMMRDIPGCFFFIGSANAEKGLDAPHHHPRFDIDEDVLPRAAALMQLPLWIFKT
jgi:amidohydrolase